MTLLSVLSSPHLTCQAVLSRDATFCSNEQVACDKVHTTQGCVLFVGMFTKATQVLGPTQEFVNSELTSVGTPTPTFCCKIFHLSTQAHNLFCARSGKLSKLWTLYQLWKWTWDLWSRDVLQLVMQSKSRFIWIRCVCASIMHIWLESGRTM